MPRLAILPVLLTCLALVFPALASGAGGADAIIKPDPPGKWHEVHYNRSTTKCASNTATPLCAIETVMRCFIREDQSLCNSVFLVSDDRLFTYPSPHNEMFFRYRILAAKRIIASDITASEIERYGPLAGEPGDLEISLDRLECKSNTKPACLDRDPERPPFAYTVRQVNGRWRVVGWGFPRGTPDYRK